MALHTTATLYTSDAPRLTPVRQASTRLTYSGGMEG